MQLIDTCVHDEEGSTTVEFTGEGGERVSVRMAATDLAEESAILRAKEIMVQLTVFDYDAPEQDVVEDETVNEEAAENSGFMAEPRS
ncbi:hypothetical protein [Shinella zoogloeoides]|uniref:hypothetical protein n=1 Tax=Shinella zoogloeoides TaxID=352475 RepID=UPI0028AFDCB3|nr:hypothetical protein [Shinella zoogloeoides]